MEKVIVKWDEAMSFTASIDGFDIKIDASEDVGGKDLGPRPKNLLLVSLAGCTGMDIASLAVKMRVAIESFSMDVEAEKNEEHPIVYTHATLVYKFKAAEADAEKILKMVSLSQERYCGVSAMLSKAFPIHYIVELNGKIIKH